MLLEFKVDAQADDRAHTVKDCHLLLVGYAPGRVADVQDALEHTPVTAEAVERPEDAVSILRQEDVDVVLLSCQYRAPEVLRPLVRQMREAAGKPIFVFCMQAGQREEVLDIISACGLDGFVPLPFFLSNLENEMAKLRTEFGNIGNVDGTIGAERGAAALRGGQSAECGNSGGAAAHAGRDLHDLQRRQAAGGGVRPRPPQRLRRYPDGTCRCP